MIIAVVDGHTDFLLLVKTRLSRAIPGSDITTFASHGSFTDFLHSASRLDLVILDETDLKKEIKEIIAEIRSKFPASPIILFSPKPLHSSRVQLVGANIYVDKSSVADLIIAAKKLLDSSQSV